MPEIERETGCIAVLVVHGIGAQQPGETVGKLLAGLRRVEGSFASQGHDCVVSLGGQPLRLYEVYWADLLMGHDTAGAFNMNEFQSLSWFPFFNALRGNYGKEDYPFLKLAWWCVVLPIFNIFVLFGYHGASFVAHILSGATGTRTEAEKDGSLQRFLRKVAGHATRLTRVDGILDEYVGDVFSYVNSAGNAFHRDEREPPVPAIVQHVYAKIVQRFYDQLIKARADGCATIQIVAHSLGTVVAFHALAGLRFEPDGREDAEAIKTAGATVRHLYTIGSPLEKIRFFWPRLTPRGIPLCGSGIKWDNFVSWFDPVAGTLRRLGDWGELANHRLLGGGFFRGHVVYEHSPVFLRALTRGLLGHEIQFESTRKERWQDGLLLVGETLLAPVATIVLLILGMALVALTATLVPFALSWVVRPFWAPEVWGPIVDTASLIILVTMLLSFLIAPAIRAKKVHSLYWVRPPSETGVGH